MIGNGGCRKAAAVSISITHPGEGDRLAKCMSLSRKSNFLRSRQSCA